MSFQFPLPLFDAMFSLKKTIEPYFSAFNSKNLGLNEQDTDATVKKIEESTVSAKKNEQGTDATVKKIALTILGAIVVISAIKLVMAPFTLLGCVAAFSVTALCVKALAPDLFQKIGQ